MAKNRTHPALTPSIPLSQKWGEGEAGNTCPAPLLPTWEKGLGDEATETGVGKR
ncbi:hypothetical protein VB712_03615 [Spirulina sp. CCNP1310]|uniref:hypothetical protein n=1 Tax=Spirulina sp. CCNP1310 TaxID=3110249 RepID=UPI002B20EAAD|nr:hypothetical protein [Spirulina sp. CCNP1310]MEA5418299.1 hypothetical protein [Spirulina sp. CCNP1310]